MRFSRSQRVLRALLGLVSVGLALFTLLMSPLPSLAATGVLLVLTAFAVLDPPSRLTTLLLIGQGLVWLMSNRVPTTLGDWLSTLVVAVGVLTIHLCAALASTLPPAAPLPVASVRRWSRRGLLVVVLSLPVWLVLVLEGRALPEGESLNTYVALAALGTLALALWLAQPQEARNLLVPDDDED